MKKFGFYLLQTESIQQSYWPKSVKNLQIFDLQSFKDVKAQSFF